MTSGRDQALDEFAALLAAMTDEVAVLTRGAKASSEDTALPDPSQLSPLDRRLLVRSIFAFCEAVAYRLKQLALVSPAAYKLTPAERALAAEEQYELDSSGESRARPAKLRFLSNLRFALRLLPKIEGAGFTPDVSGRGWQPLQRTVAVRDRLAHPKVSADLQVTDDEARDALTGYAWLYQEIVLLLISVVRAVRAETSRLRALVATGRLPPARH
jgi:hypothetical protein